MKVGKFEGKVSQFEGHVIIKCFCLVSVIITSIRIAVILYYFLKVLCKSKKEGKHKASQQILQVCLFVYTRFDDVTIV